MDKVELVREGLRRFAVGDETGMLELFHPDIEVWATDETLNSGSYKGREGVQRWYREWHDAWERIEYEALDFIDVSDAILVVPFRMTAAARDGLELEGEMAWMFEIEGGLLKRWELHGDPDGALAAARTWLAGQTGQ